MKKNEKSKVKEGNEGTGLVEGKEEIRNLIREQIQMDWKKKHGSEINKKVLEDYVDQALNP